MLAAPVAECAVHWRRAGDLWSATAGDSCVEDRGREGSNRATYHEARGGTGLPEEEHAGWYRQAIEDTGQVHKVQGRRP
jgi:hypothetical protein